MDKKKNTELYNLKVSLDEGAFMPTRAHPEDAGLDLYSMKTDLVPAGGSCIFDTGFHIQIPPGYVGMVKSKSGLLFKHGLVSEGTIDSGYTGSVKVKLVNLSKKDYFIEKGDRISQLVILPIMYPISLQIAEELEETERGESGFGASGK